MIIKSSVCHEVGLYGFVKFCLKKGCNDFASLFVTPLPSDMLYAFVVGCGHSGTTLLSAKLSRHSSVMGVGRETSILLPGRYSFSTIKAVAREWEYFAEFYGFDCVLEKTPKHVYSYGRAQKVIPNNKFLVMIRNPLDTVASLYKRFGDLDFCINRWVYDNSEVLKFWGRPNVFVVRYEDLTEQPEITLSRVVEFLGYQYEVSLMGGGGSVYGKICQYGNMKIRKEQVESPIKPNSGVWNKVLDRSQVVEVVDKVGDTAKRLGYSLPEL